MPPHRWATYRAVSEESGEYVRGRHAAPWKTTGEAVYREAWYDDGNLFQRGSDVGDTDTRFELAAGVC